MKTRIEEILEGPISPDLVSEATHRFEAKEFITLKEEDKEKFLLYAILCGDKEVFEAILASGCDIPKNIEEYFYKDRSPVSTNYYVRFWIRKMNFGAPHAPEVIYKTVFEKIKFKFEKAKFLLTAAVENRNIPLIKVLLANKVPFDDYKDPLSAALDSKYNEDVKYREEIIELVIAHMEQHKIKPQQNALYLFVRIPPVNINLKERVGAFLIHNLGKEINDSGRYEKLSPLRLALEKEDEATIKLLLENKAIDKNQLSYVNTGLPHQPLTDKAKRIFRLLIESKADLNISNVDRGSLWDRTFHPQFNDIIQKNIHAALFLTGYVTNFNLNSLIATLNVLVEKLNKFEPMEDIRPVFTLLMEYELRAIIDNPKISTLEKQFFNKDYENFYKGLTQLMINAHGDNNERFEKVVQCYGYGYYGLKNEISPEAILCYGSPEVIHKRLKEQKPDSIARIVDVNSIEGMKFFLANKQEYKDIKFEEMLYRAHSCEMVDLLLNHFKEAPNFEEILWRCLAKQIQDLKKDNVKFLIEHYFQCSQNMSSYKHNVLIRSYREYSCLLKTRHPQVTDVNIIEILGNELMRRKEFKTLGESLGYFMQYDEMEGYIKKVIDYLIEEKQRLDAFNSSSKYDDCCNLLCIAVSLNQLKWVQYLLNKLTQDSQLLTQTTVHDFNALNIALSPPLHDENIENRKLILQLLIAKYNEFGIPFIKYKMGLVTFALSNVHTYRQAFGISPRYDFIAYQDLLTIALEEGLEMPASENLSSQRILLDLMSLISVSRISEKFVKALFHCNKKCYDLYEPLTSTTISFMYTKVEVQSLIEYYATELKDSPNGYVILEKLLKYHPFNLLTPYLGKDVSLLVLSYAKAGKETPPVEHKNDGAERRLGFGRGA